MTQGTKTIKCIVVGENGSGRKSLITAMVERRIPTYFPMTGLNPSEYHVLSKIDKCEVDLQFWYCSGGDEYDRLRPLSYPDSCVVLLCFAINSREQFERISSKYNEEIRKHCGNGIPVILIGTKSDLRDKKSEDNVKDADLVAFRDGKNLAVKINALNYIECSAVKMQWVDLIVRQASSAGYYYWKSGGMKKLNQRNSYCRIV